MIVSKHLRFNGDYVNEEHDTKMIAWNVRSEARTITAWIVKKFVVSIKSQPLGNVGMESNTRNINLLSSTNFQ